MFPQDQEIFNILLASISEGVVIVDNQQNIVEINSAAEYIFGYSKEEIVNKKLDILIPSNYHNSHKKHFDTFLKKGKRRTMGESHDIYGLTKLGDIKEIEVELNPFTVYHRQYIMALVKDVSELKQTEKDLMLKSSALQSANNGIIITDALVKDNPIIYFNPAFQRLTGYSSKEILNHNCRFLQGKDRDQEGLVTLRKAIKKGESCQVTLRNYKKDGSLFWNDLYIMPIINKNGILTHFIGIQNDVTKRKHAEAERNHFANIFHESLNEIYVFDAETLRFINVNYGAQKNIGFQLSELQTMTPVDIKPEYNEKEFREQIDILTKDKVHKLEFETLHKRKDGTTYPVNVHLQRTKLGDKDIYIAIVLDISDQKNYTKKLEKTVAERTEELQVALKSERELNDLKTKFLSLVSHEFKTPLSAIQTSAILLSKYALESQQAKRDKHIKTISDKVNYLNNIINDFLSLEKLEKGKVEYKFSTFKISKVINEVIYNANMVLKDGQHINYPDDVDELSMYQDEKILELALTNLVNNAIKYSSEDTVIDIDIKQKNNKTIFVVGDNGIGIPKKDQKNIFQRYFRAENVLLSQGTGIGLNIVKEHIENLDGKIYFTSEEGEGSVFTIELPNAATS
ncbi:PAS domain S-box protein [Psychroserpens sp.]|uniref:PAS domain-containing sensor histidine kinase n=1 Tax=Psychroserpens sp. TaxID=2020870 RepID=UPI001B080339|nr:PAS domain S-box protein [Psychroserpens sp.]MBO6607498.1 PAS domain S-box protein [Psychroserpens sp.]MBO6654424.1 PAS domain S-box protein [Psychroserpens sp.]MBO6681227.1 PAS domain S-box protein [Psychroserpens sp.]MBO6749816.1 PAS domain S-box protein [Psychroserpens sp.]MBO6916196.1 PAS domain S-box protein [Psychroserpens sp.]